METQVTHERGSCPRCRSTVEQECTKVTGANGAVAVEFRVCKVCGAVT